MKRFGLMLLSLGVLAAGTSRAQSVAGEWDAEFNTPGGARTMKLVLKVNGAELSGSVQRAADTLPLAGTIKGDTVRFSYTIVYNGNPLELWVTALVSGDTMAGSISFGGMAEDEFSAKRARRPPSR
jgi:hypothetical protein